MSSGRAAARAGKAALRLTGTLAKARWHALQREATRPWRTGAKGRDAEIGRWIGAGLAVGAKALGVGSAVYAFLKRR